MRKVEIVTHGYLFNSICLTGFRFISNFSNISLHMVLNYISDTGSPVYRDRFSSDLSSLKRFKLETGRKFGLGFSQYLAEPSDPPNLGIRDCRSGEYVACGRHAAHTIKSHN